MHGKHISMGVPIAAWPIHSNQPKNAVPIPAVLKVGLVARDWQCRENSVTFSRIKNAVGIFMASEEGDQIRKRANELGGILPTLYA